MKLTKENICVFIENESQLQEARELLERYGEESGELNLDNFLEGNVSKNLNNIGLLCGEWMLMYKPKHAAQITLTELETILKEEYGK